ncbi:MAG: sugar-transfer associated ATP-grasp domain-containing protein [Phaeovulum sp.]|uniref:sugar-transfer associated ATP-grasp domain-containing protein n=1 Tax=Phaeovulum sp. TaxID=2934796 RepID=UPI00273587B2|nr:sugar-transfer associated ATP-grasp domain-containing protein [Phaeovulum sp.]MDP3860848.1 sugar-transfer associated ATP-grasp domain-containing protein [Phaeovulum sp.]
MTATKSETILATRIRANKPDLAFWLRKAQSAGGRSTAAMIWDMARLARGPGKLRPYDYLRYELYRPTLSAAERAAFLSPHGSDLLNARFSPPSRELQSSLTIDKVLTAVVLKAAGFPVPETRAILSVDANYGAMSALRTAADIVAFLRDPANLPVFGKPVNSSQSVGAASFLSVTPDGAEVLLGDGRQASVAAIADEIMQYFHRGYLFQELLRQPPEIIAIAGETLSSMRLVTLWVPGGPQLLYAGSKLPAPGAMVDSLMGGDNVLVLIDPATGEATRAMLSASGGRKFITHSQLFPEAPVVGMHYPHWAEVTRMATEAHRMFPGHGILGFDIVQTTRGPVITEINTNPHHALYQFCADRGMLNPEFRVLFAAAEIDQERRRADQKLRDAAFNAASH